MFEFIVKIRRHGVPMASLLVMTDSTGSVTYVPRDYIKHIAEGGISVQSFVAALRKGFGKGGYSLTILTICRETGVVRNTATKIETEVPGILRGEVCDLFSCEGGEKRYGSEVAKRAYQEAHLEKAMRKFHKVNSTQTRLYRS